MPTQPNKAPEPVQYCYSHDEERYYGRFDSIEEALAEARDDEDGAWIGEIVDPVKYINPQWLGEHVREWIEECLGYEVGEAVEFFKLTSEQEEEIGQMVIDYIVKGPGFNCFGVKNAKWVEFAARATGAAVSDPKLTHEPIRKAFDEIWGAVVALRAASQAGYLKPGKDERALLILADEIDRVTRERDEALKDARRYRMVRRGQHWSVINGIGDTLRGEELDAAIDAALGDVGV